MVDTMTRDMDRRTYQSGSWTATRRFPRTLSTFQISLLCGFASLLILKSVMGGSFGISLGHSHSDSRPSEPKFGDIKSEGKRNLAQFSEEMPKIPSFKLGPKITDWDEQRAAWLEAHPKKRTTSEGKPRVILATGTSPWPCQTEKGDFYNLISLKNKIDYARIHEYEIFHNMAFIHDKMNSLWAKLPLVRKLMISHPEAEWIFWVDADALITDMVFEMPLETYDQYNIIMWGLEDSLFEDKNWVAMNTGVFFMRNCQWSLDLLDMWVPMGPEGKVRDEMGRFFTSVLTQGKGQKRPVMTADDQSALVYLLNTNEEVLRSKIYLENKKFLLSGYFDIIVDNFEDFMSKFHPGLGDHRWPFTTHFTGCQPCTGKGNPVYSKDRCTLQFERAYHFADNQVMNAMGLQHTCLGCADLKKIGKETDHPLETLKGDNTWLPRSSLKQH